MGLTSQGTLVGWGEDSSTQLEVPLGASRDVLAVSAGQAFNLAVVVPAPPVVADLPPTLEVPMGRPAWLSVRATGYPISFQWSKNGQEIPGATASTLSLGQMQPLVEGQYSVTVSGIGGNRRISRTVSVSGIPVVGSMVRWGFPFYDLTNVPPAALGSISSVAVGRYNEAVVTTNHLAVLWGNAGDGGYTNLSVADRSQVLDLALGTGFALARRLDGRTVLWPTNTPASPPIPAAVQEGARAIAASERLALAVSGEGQVVVWGSDFFNQKAVPVSAQSGVVAVVGGGEHVLALKNDGSVVAWGSTNNGRCQIPPQAQHDVVAIAASFSYSLALKNDGSVVQWGGIFKPFPAAASQDAVALSSGPEVAVAIRDGGVAVLWPESSSLIPALQEYQGAYRQIAGSASHSIALVDLPNSLRVQRSAGEVILRWPQALFRARLQATPSLSSPVVWTDRAGDPAFTSEGYVLTNRIGSGSEWFRLVLP